MKQQFSGLGTKLLSTRRRNVTGRLRINLSGIGLLAIFGLFALTSPFLPAQTPPAVTTNGPDASELESLHASIKTFFENITDPSSGPKKGLETLMKNSPLNGNDKDEMINALSEKITSIKDQFGPYVSFEPIGVKMVGRDLVILRYLYKCQNYPVVWYFIFYRPLSANGETGNKTWFLIHFYYDSQLNLPLWESGF